MASWYLHLVTYSGWGSELDGEEVRGMQQNDDALNVVEKERWEVP